MKSILKDTNNAARLLQITADTLLLLDAEGVCQDIRVNLIDLWFLKEEHLLG